MNKNNKIIFKFFFIFIIFILSFGLLNSTNDFNYSTQDKVFSPRKMNPLWQDTDQDFSDEQYYLETINIFDAWELETGKEDVLVAIIDTGIDTDHEEFSGRISELSYNLITEEVGIAAVEDVRGHGTNVAGIIAADMNNDIGIKGMTNNIEIMVIKADYEGESTHTYSNANIAKGITYAVDNGANIINLSLGSLSPSTQIRDAIDYAYENQVIIVASAGNEGNDNDYYPAAFDNVIAVGAINEDYSLTTFSNYGDYIDVVAPGLQIMTTDLNNGYAKVSGTSFSAPQVTGALALLLSYKDVSYYEAIQAITDTTTDLGDEGRDNIYGYGLIDTYNLLIDEFITITFDTNGLFYIDSIALEKGQKYGDIEIPESEDFIFHGLYLDEDYTIPYSADYVFETDTTLYANFEQIYYTVSFYYGYNLVERIEVGSGERIENYPEIDEEGKEFKGWYYSEKFIDKFDNEKIKSDIKLYAKFTITEVKVTFLDAYDEIFYETYINYGTNFSPPEKPTLPSTNIFAYEFDSWDHKITDITEDTVFRPIFNKIFISDNVILNPGIDTIFINETWIDSGISLLDESLYYETSGQINAEEIGLYKITYEIYHETEKVYEVVRFVNIIDNDITIEIEIEPTVTTILKGTYFSPPQASSNYGEVEVISNINYEIIGQYAITYRVEYNGMIKEKTLFVYVIESYVIPFNEIDWFIEKGDEDE